MKIHLAIAVLLLSFAAGAQNISQYSFTQFSADSAFKAPDFSYYSNNYNKVFGEYYFIINTRDFGQRSIYLSETNFYYNTSRNLPYIQPLNENYLAGPDTTAAGIIGVSVMGIQALMSGNLFDKDYSPRDVDKSLFHPSE